jgi:hypothetical protein
MTHYSTLGPGNQQWIDGAIPFTASDDTWSAYFAGASPGLIKSAQWLARRRKLVFLEPADL